MRVLVACEYSGTVRRAFAARGHDAWSCDLLPADDDSPNHIMGDVRYLINGPGAKTWDLMIAHPPCTYMTNAGVCWLHKDPSRWDKLGEAAVFFKELYNCDVPRICVENPIMHKYARDLIGVSYTHIVQPWMFGHTEQKATCLWLKDLPPLVKTSDVKSAMMKLPHRERNRLHYLPPSKDRWKIRSTTYQGIADAMASQWG